MSLCLMKRSIVTLFCANPALPIDIGEENETSSSSSVNLLLHGHGRSSDLSQKIYMANLSISIYKNSILVRIQPQ
jgi:hypothetical protein